MDLIERYVYSVTSKLPEKQREDIAKELRTLIADMMEELPTEISESEKIEQVLLKLGDPYVLADNYRDNKRYLIGPKNFPQYLFVLKIVFIAITIAVTVGSIINFIFQEVNFATMIGNYISSIIMGLVQGFAWVTIIFAVAEYKGVDFNEEKEPWELKKLPKVPNKKAKISKVESIFGIVFISIFTIIFYFYPHIIAIYIPNEDGYNVVQIFTIDNLNNLRILIIGMFAVGIIREMLKLIFGRWNIELAIYYSILTVISVILFIIFITNPSIWNENIVSELSQYINVEVDYNFNKDKILNIIIKIFIAINLIDIATVIYKGIKYDKK